MRIMIRVLAMILAIFIGSFYIWLTLVFIAMANNANAKEPAKVEILGTPSAFKEECEGQRSFTEHVINLRVRGVSQNEVIGMILARAISIGMPPESLAHLKAAAINAWDIPLPAKEAGDAVYETCLEIKKQDAEIAKKKGDSV